jgi:hypothetical protein
MVTAAAPPLETLIGAIERFVQVPTLELTPTELGDRLRPIHHPGEVFDAFARM